MNKSEDDLKQEQDLMEYRALVTGATGYVGSRVTRCLVGHQWQVDALVRPSSDLVPLKDVRDQVTTHVWDGQIESIQQIIADREPTVVFHLASLFLSEHQPTDVSRLVESNLLLGLQLAEAMASQDNPMMINTGTSWQHFESDDYRPVNLYAATKQAFEDLLQFYVDSIGMKVITLKLSDTYGPDDPRPKLINMLRRMSPEDEPLKMSPGEQMIDLVHIDDVVRAYLLAADRLMTGSVDDHERYAVSSGNPLALRDVVDRLEQASGQDVPVAWGGRAYREREVMVPWRGKWLPGWQPGIDLDTGFRMLSQSTKGEVDP